MNIQTPTNPETAQRETLLSSLSALPRAAWILFFGTFLNKFGGFVVPFLTLYLTDRGYTVSQTGLAVSAYGVGNLGASLLGGHLADKLGRRKTIVFSMFSGAAAMMLLSQAHSLGIIIVLTALTGLTNEFYRPASQALLADIVPSGQRMTAFAAVQGGVAAWALLIPALEEHLRRAAPAVAALAPDSLLLTTLVRFGLSFVVLAPPCVLMGMTLPLLIRAMAHTPQHSSRRVGALYCWNTLGAALGCWTAGYCLLDTLGMRATNSVVVAVTLFVGLVALGLGRRTGPHAEATADVPDEEPRLSMPLAGEAGDKAAASGATLLAIAFASGVAGLTCEVLWFRYLAFFLFLGRPAYVFSLILCLYLLGLGVGGFVYSLVASRVCRPARALALVQLALALSVPCTFALGALLFVSGPPAPVGVAGMAAITVLLPTTLMGFAFPLLCHLYGGVGPQQGRRVGRVVALNCAGTVVGSLLPVFVLVPWLGIQHSIVVVALLCGGMGMALLLAPGLREKRTHWTPLLGAAAALALIIAIVPAKLCQRVFLAIGFDLARHTDILFYREGRTGTAIVTRDRVNDRKVVYINGNPEVPALYAHELCFKMLGDLGPMLHPHPDDVLMVCFGGGIAAGATTQLPAVKSLTIVDLESSVVEAAGLLAQENHGVLRNPKTRVVIDDGRNYVMNSDRKWPVIITDSTHPKAPDSWVLYSQEFYRQVHDHLTNDGVFVQWVPPHDLTADEYKIIVRTFQSVFPHTSLWVNAGMDERGQFIVYTLLVATPGPLSIDASKLRQRLAATPVHADLNPYGLATVPGFLDNFVSADETLRHWVGPGPLNTDDLPYTYYVTPYARGPRMGNVALLEPMEDIWPRLTNTGAADEAAQLHRELTTRARATRLALSGRLEQAYALLPGDPRYDRLRELYAAGPHYSQALAAVFWDDPAGLSYVAGLGAPGRGAFDAAQRLYERILQLDPDNLNALNMLGCMRSDLGDVPGAESLLSRAVRLHPKSPFAQYNFGTLLLKKGSLDDAAAHFRRALELKSDYADVHANLGTLALQRGHLDDAISEYDTALRLDPESADASFNLSLALSRAGRIPQAIDRYERTLKLRPEDPEILNDLAWLLATAPSERIAARTANAVHLAQRANELTGGKFPPVLRTLAAAYAGAGRFREAIDQAEAAADLAQAADRRDFVEQVRHEIALYQAGQPVRDLPNSAAWR